jgi:hypothetical protein
MQLRPSESPGIATLFVRGHASDNDSHIDNQTLSERRAEADMSIMGVGDRMPLGLIAPHDEP